MKYIIIGSIVFLLLYLFVAPVPMNYDIFFEPVWSRDITRADASAAGENIAESTAENIEAFILGNRFGYFTPEGDIIYSGQTENRIAASKNSWAVYPQNASGTVIYNSDGSPKMTIEPAGYVHIDYDRTYLFLPGGSGVSQYSETGDVIWTREHAAPITAFNSSPEGTIIGYADGKLSSFRADGSEIFSFYPGGSDYQVILGAAISEDGTLAACVSGIDRQRFLLIKITGRQYKIIFHAYLDGNLRRQTFVDFEQNGRFVFFEYENGIGIVDCKQNSLSKIPMSGQLIAAGEFPGDNVFVILVKEGETFKLSAVERSNHLVASARFSARNAFLIQHEKIIYLGTDDRISRINIKGSQ
ncbi:hypothetical protein K7I13_14635 [Brucepastera parasyntrophica]|uniref:hypothetical protein n=1 Tax=Brucepastera parasyntrophica TaxID=2880008 RepID=UPI00210CC014|nr:hypothetical protein [Brucepastera parasyntrophica]ULQ59671.1 hypothetical protein K7I13_14635 [Brucepastera parasyntrophica]